MYDDLDVSSSFFFISDLQGCQRMFELFVSKIGRQYIFLWNLVSTTIYAEPPSVGLELYGHATKP